MLARFAQIGTALLTVPLTLKYLGNERFGLWMTISSVLAMATFADFGVGNGVLNTVAKAFGKDDIPGIHKAISSGFTVLSAIAVFLLITFFSIYSFVNWPDFFNVVSPLARSEAGPAFAVFAICFALNISLDVVQRVQLGLQEGYRFSLWQLCGSMMGLVGVLGGIWLHVSLPVLVVAIAGAPVFATLLNAIHFFGFVRPDLRPRRDLVFRTVIVQVTKLGGLFFVLQVAAALSISADNFIIARMLGAVNVPEYSIPQRMFGVLSMLFAMFLAPFWPAYGEAVSRGDMGWVRRTLGRSLLRVLPVSFMASALLLLIAPKLIDLWVGHRIHPPFLLLLGLAVLSVFECCRNLLGVFLNGANALRFQVALASSFGLACIVMKVLFIGRWGIVVLPWATILGCLAVEVIPWILFIPRFLRNLEAKPERLPYAQGQFNPSAIAKWGEAGNIPQ